MNTNTYTLDEFIDLIQAALTMSGALPCILPNADIERIVRAEAMPWFYQNVYRAVQKVYYYAPIKSFLEDKPTKYKYIQLPDDVQNVVWLHPMNDRSLFQLGVFAPNLSLNIDMTNQPMLTSFMTTVGDLGVYKMIIDGFADVLNQSIKSTYKFAFNQNNKRLEILTKLDNNLVVECYANIEAEALFADPQFYMYCVALCRIQLGDLLTIYDMPLPGGVKINGGGIKDRGIQERDKILEDIKAESKSSWFFMTKR